MSFFVAIPMSSNVCDTKEVAKLKDPFLKELLKYWAETNLVNQVCSEIVIQEQVLWFNSLLKKVNEPIFASRSEGL